MGCQVGVAAEWPNQFGRGIAGELRFTPSKGPAAPTLPTLKGGVALQVWAANLRLLL